MAAIENHHLVAECWDRNAAAAEAKAAAEKAVADIEAGWKRGADVEPAVHAEAVSAHAQASAIRDAARAAFKAAVEQTRNVDKRVAEAVAETIKPLLPGVTVLATFADIEEAPAANERPVVIVRQVKESKTDATTGELIAEVHLEQFVPTIYADAPVLNIELLDAISTSRTTVIHTTSDKHSRPVPGGVGQYRLRVKVSTLPVDTLPFIATVQDDVHTLSAIGCRLATALASTTLVPEEGSDWAWLNDNVSNSPSQRGGVFSSRRSWQSVPFDSLSHTVEHVGTETIVSVSGSMEVRGQALKGPERLAGLQAACAPEVGTLVAGLGVVESVTVERDPNFVPPEKHPGATGYIWRAVLKSTRFAPSTAVQAAIETRAA
ncbi:hypothetical protein [Nocardioides sp. R-C-SC26]|uniref:hypothetical protein n=1 Tax=Nocardioides sp. R-C-SC26 TaxID=2870414 RepID=UPI001E304AA1|nr:hypothetical protein [Nocardioides sp. R-C-SC26]